MSKRLNLLFSLFLVLSMALPMVKPTGSVSAQSGAITFTILHTNDFHGQLEASGSNPGLARVAAVVNSVRTAKAGNVLLVDGGDEMQGSLLSNLQKGEPTIAAFNAAKYDVATFGNHEFDWGQTNLALRTAQAQYTFVTANIVKGDCSGWVQPDFVKAPYVVKSVAGVKVAFIGVTTTEVPTITVASATAGLCFKDPADSIIHYYSQMKAEADVIVVLSHLGFNDGGYGYGIPVYGDKTLAQKLIDAGDPVPLIIGGHSHTDMGPLTGTPLPNPLPANYVTVGGKTAIVQAYYNGRRVGEADLSYDPSTKNVMVSWQSLIVDPKSTNVDADVNNVITTYSSDPDYQTKINQPVGYTQVDLVRDYNGDNLMGDFVDDAIYNYLNTDAEPKNDVDLFFNNAGGIRIDWCAKADSANPGAYIWSSTAADCTKQGTWAHDPMLLNYGQMFQILPFGNATVVGDMTGAQILQVLNQSATLGKGAIQPSGMNYKFYAYKDTNPGPQPYAWGAFDACVVNKTTKACDPLDLNKTYRVGTNEFLAPAGGDNYGGFKYMTNITYWGDMLDAVNSYVSATYTQANPYNGPKGDGLLDGRITRDGTDTPDSGSIKPITILHHNDSHGNLTKGTYVGYTQLATLIKQERAHNPNRTLLLDGGDAVQGDAMMYYFKSAPSGFAADGTPLPAAEQIHPMINVLNSMGYDAFVLGNHEFNFGGTVFQGIFAQAQFPVLGANVSDTGDYGLAKAQGGAGVQPYIEKTLDGIKVAVLGITNHRVPNYELPSNIVGLTFSNPIATAQQDVPALRAKDDAVIALTHIGFTTNPKSVEVDENVDTNLAAQVSGIDAIIGSHSHTNPASPEAPYKFLPTIVGGPNNTPVIINQAYRYNNTLGEVILGMRKNDQTGKYEVVSRAGQYITVQMSTAEDPATVNMLAPYVETINTYNNTVVGQTTAPIDTLKAFTEETNGANLQAEASVAELAKHGINDVDFHLSGAMTNKLMASGATEANPVTLKISDMFAGMPYENSLVVLKMNGPQLKAVLERAYRNYYYYKYVSGYGGYSYYTTCMIDINNIGRIYYKDTNPTLPDGNNVVALVINGKPVDFNDATKYYNVSTVNYLAAGSCNFNDNGKSLWPLNQIVHDTQYYVRDAVIDYLADQKIVSPKVEGRLLFGDTTPPVVTINAPTTATYTYTAKVPTLTLDFGAVDGADGTTPSFAPPSGVKSIEAKLDKAVVKTGDKVDLLKLPAGNHTLTVTATDYYGNATTQSVTFINNATVDTVTALVKQLYTEKQIKTKDVYNSLNSMLMEVKTKMQWKQYKSAITSLNSFKKLVTAQSGKNITKDAATLLLTDAQYLIDHMPVK